MASKGLSTAVGCLSFLLASCLSYATVDTGFISAVVSTFQTESHLDFEGSYRVAPSLLQDCQYSLRQIPFMQYNAIELQKPKP